MSRRLRAGSRTLDPLVASKAAGNDVLTSGTVKDIVAGSALRFDDRGVHELEGIDEPRRLYAVN